MSLANSDSSLRIPPGVRIAVYMRAKPEVDRFVPGDRFLKPWVRALLKRRPKPSGLQQVRSNLLAALAQSGIEFVLNPSPLTLRPNDWVLALGIGRDCLRGIPRDRPLVAGIGVMGHPSEWPELASDFDVRTFLQHSRWASDLYRPLFGSRCREWPVGIDTDLWNSEPNRPPDAPVLIYRKFLWERDRLNREIMQPVLEAIARRNIGTSIIEYGSYRPDEYRQRLASARAMIFLSAHESQGIAYQEAMSCGVPIVAWDPGFSMNPDGCWVSKGRVPTTSVPYFGPECGRTFGTMDQFDAALDEVLDLQLSGQLDPRSFVLRHLSYARSTEILLGIMSEVMPP